MKIDIKQLRKIEGITPLDISTLLDISQAYTSMLVNGKRKMLPQFWNKLTDSYPNITNYVTDWSEISTDEENNDITDIMPDVPAYILDIIKKNNEQISALVHQNELLMDTVQQQMDIVRELMGHLGHTQPSDNDCNS